MLSAAHKCEEGEKIALTDFTKPFDCSYGQKNKRFYCIIYLSDFVALILLFVIKYFGTCSSIFIELGILFSNGVQQMPH